MVQARNEQLGPAERIIQTLLTYSDHMVHNRPGVVTRDASSVTGVRWEPVTHEEAGGEKVVYKLQQQRVGKKMRTTRTRIGVLEQNGNIVEGGRVVGRYQPAGLFEEVAVWMYRQVAEVWKLDNEFAARWASYAFGQDHKDLKTVLAAFMLVQSRKGDPQFVDGKAAFCDEDYRAVGEAMLLLQPKDPKAGLTPRLMLRIYDLLCLPGIAAINRELGFGRSTRRPFLGRWVHAVERWLEYREENPKMLEGLVKAGYRLTVMKLAQHAAHAGGGYKPTNPRFFELLRWKQKQASTGHRELAIGQAVKAAESWEGLDEHAICERIERTRLNWKRIVSLVPTSVGITRAIMAAAVESEALSNKDLIIATPTLEELGLLEVPSIKQRWEKAVKAAEDMRAANIARNVKSAAVKETLEVAAVGATQKAAEEVTRNMRVYVVVDVSGSMEGAIEAAKQYVTKFLPAFPLDRLHVSTFNTSGVIREIRHASAAGVEAAFRGITASGGTAYETGVQVLVDKYRPKDDEDVLFVFFGDEDAHPFADIFRRKGVKPMAFGFVKVLGRLSRPNQAVRQTAAELGIPCFMIDEKTFDDPYAIPRTIRALVAATPVGHVAQMVAVPRVTLVDTILKTDLLQKPAWALPDPPATAEPKAKKKQVAEPPRPVI